MKAGKLTHRITIQQRTESQLASGQIVGTWEDYDTVWAEIRCTDAKAVDEAGVIHHEGLYEFYIRYRSDLDAEMRIVWNDRTFTLVAPPVDWKTTNLGITLTAKELV